MNFFLDSGAYSAVRSGRPIKIDDYCRFIHDNRAWLTLYAAPDVITPGEPDAGAEESWKNYEIMLSQGLDPVPVFHFGEDIKWLRRYLDAGASYIALGGTAIYSHMKTRILEWHDIAWQVLADQAGRPVVRVHAFGETDDRILRRFPWQSADSATWIHVLRNRSLFRNGHRCLWSELTDDERAHAMRGMRTNEEELWSNGKLGRILQTYLTARHYIELQSIIRARGNRRLARADGFFGHAASDSPAVELDPFNMYLSISAFPPGVAALDLLGHDSSLGSFFYLTPEWQRIFGQGQRVSDIAPYNEYCDMLRDRILP